MHEVLNEFENWKRLGKMGNDKEDSLASAKTKSDSLSLLNDIVINSFKTLLRTRVLRGCPLNIPFTDSNEILYKVCLIQYINHY
jgi:hypothetical protein